MEWEGNPALIRAEAQALRAVSVPVADDPLLYLDEELDEIAASEGRSVLVAHYRRERNRALRQAKIAAVRARGGHTGCEVCGFDFEATYGKIGEDFIEVHHVVPLHVSGETITRLGDLALLCSNCHRMVHRAIPWLTPDQLRERLR